jgi:ribosomal protein S12 methylthiotransferase
VVESRYWLQTLGCPKNQVDSDKLEGRLAGQGYQRAADPSEADLVVVNTCAFIESARQESIDTVLELADLRRDGARLVVTGCMAERYGSELTDALPEVDLVAGFGIDFAPPLGVPVTLTRTPGPRPSAGFDLLELARPASEVPWAYVKVAEGCDRICGFCAIPSFRGKQRSRHVDEVMAEVELLLAGGTTAGGTVAPPVREIVLVAQDLASYGRDRSRPGERVKAGRSGLTDELIDAVLSTGVPYFDLSLQHVSRPLLARMRRWGDGERFLRRIADIRAADEQATFRSSFILGYPGETEHDHDRLLEFLAEAQLDWAGFFPFSNEAGTHAADLPDQVPAALALERLRECAELQDGITAARRDLLVGQRRQVLVDAPGRGRTVHEAPEIDGIVHLPDDTVAGELLTVMVTAAVGPDLYAVRDVRDVSAVRDERDGQ